MKELYSFNIEVESEVDEITETTNEAGENIKVTKKVKKSVPRRVVLKKPGRDMEDEAELFYGVEKAKGIRAGLLTRAMLEKRFQDDGGILSDKEKEKYTSLYTELISLEEKYTKLSANEQTEEEKSELEAVKKKIAENRTEIQNYEMYKYNLFNETADARAENKILAWWLVNMVYIENSKNELVPMFNGKDHKEKLNSYDEINEDKDIFKIKAINQSFYFITLWFLKHCSTKEEFDKMAIDYKF